MPGQFEVRAEGDALPSRALSPFPISSPISSDSPIEQMLGNALELHVSNMTLIEETGEKRERQSSVRVLTDLASGARLFRSADGHTCARLGSAIDSRFMGSGRLGSATG